MFKNSIKNIKLVLWQLEANGNIMEYSEHDMLLSNITELIKYLTSININKIDSWNIDRHYEQQSDINNYEYYSFETNYNDYNLYIYVYINNKIDCLTKKEITEQFTSYYNKELRVFKINKLIC